MIKTNKIIQPFSIRKARKRWQFVHFTQHPVGFHREGQIEWKNKDCVSVYWLHSRNLAIKKSVMQGILTEANARNIDTAVFAPFIREGRTEKFRIGEKNIFNLVNYNRMDGVIFVPDMIRIAGAVDEITQKLHEKFSGPVICLDGSIDGFTSVLFDDDKKITAIIRHLIQVHHCRDIAFMTGTKGHIHSAHRLKGYYAAMQESDLPIRENRIFYGDFWYDQGETVVTELLQAPLPDAIACASDTMAISVIDALTRYGIRVPEDLLVTGFDCDGDGIIRPYSVTSAARHPNQAGSRAVVEICRQLGFAQPTTAEISPELYLTASCGCDANSQPPTPAQSVSYNLNYQAHDYNTMLEDIIGAADATECLWNIDWYTSYIGGFDTFSICFCENWDGSACTGDTAQPVTTYTKKICLAYDKKKNQSGSVDVSRCFDVEMMHPRLIEPRDFPSVFYFSPLHFMDRCFGYTVLSYENSTETYDSNFCTWSRNISCAFESFRRQSILTCTNEHINAMYRAMEKNAVTDLLTGLHNRNGFHLYASQLLEKAQQEDKRLFMLMCDMNNLKIINDTYGHIAGDQAIQIVAESFKTCFPDANDTGRSFRIGGDEFVYIAVVPQCNINIDLVKSQLREQANALCRAKVLPFLVSISIGTVCTKIDDTVTIDSMLSRADQIMYQNKAQIKAGTPAAEDLSPVQE